MYRWARLFQSSPTAYFDYIQIGIDEGAHLATGGKAVHPQGFEQGYFIEPTIMTNCHDDMRIVREEIFGPVMSVLTFKTEDEAIKRANDRFWTWRRIDHLRFITPIVLHMRFMRKYLD